MNTFRIKSVITIVLATTILLCPNVSDANNPLKLRTKNMRIAEKLYSIGYNENACQFYALELTKHPRNGYAYYHIGNIIANDTDLLSQFGSDALIECFDNAIEYLPNRDGKYLALAYTYRAVCYMTLIGDNEKAEQDLCMAITYANNIETLRTIYNIKASLYSIMQEYESEIYCYLKLLEYGEDPTTIYYKIGTAEMLLYKYEKAIQYFTYAIDNGYENLSLLYFYRSYCHFSAWEDTEAIDDAIKSLEAKENDLAEEMLVSASKNNSEYALWALTIQRNKDDDNASMWLYNIGNIYYNQKQYDNAIKYYKEAFSNYSNDKYIRGIFNSLYMMGDYETAYLLNERILSNSNALMDVEKTAMVKYAMGNADAAIKELAQGIEDDNENDQLYYCRGNIYEAIGEYEKAENDYIYSNYLNPYNPACHLACGRVYQKLGKSYEAKKEFMLAIEHDFSALELCTTPYAYFYLGETDMALKAIEEMVSNKKNYFDAACIYSMAGEKQLAIEYLEKSLENGGLNFINIEKNPCLENVKNMPDFIRIVNMYKEKARALTLKNSTIISHYELKDIVIPYTMENGVMMVTCKINGIQTPFIFDTGAAHVAISLEDALKMISDGKITEEDYLGTESYSDASGNTSINEVVNLKNVEFGELKIKNVIASVSKNKNAPQLLGLSALQKFGKIEIDTENKRIIIKHLCVKQ